MADTYSKKEREKKKAQKKREKALRKEQRREEGKQPDVIMYVDHNGNFTENKPEHIESDIDPADIATSVPKDPESENEVGYVKFFNVEKGFGFIKGGRRVGDINFSAPEPALDLRENDKVTFEIGEGDNGSYAYNIEKV